ncbi:MAG: circadian clock protein KaiC [Gammaproteobacteria bacterium]|nr:circadian clock protein KaiC [Gammaproteobacteria bacterium]
MGKTLPELAKSATGIEGLDEITNGGLPSGRPTLICGYAGCGKTLLGMQFLVNGATRFDEPGVFVAFEESREELAQNVASLGYDLPALVKHRQLYIDHVELSPGSVDESGEYDLEGLFIRMGRAIDAVGARRVVLDTLETLFAGLDNQKVLRAELHRLFHWLKQRGITAIITGERCGATPLTRHGLEEYVSDCVILLDQRVDEQASMRRLRIVKYRGSAHGGNEYPFLINQQGLITLLPITSTSLTQEGSNERISSGIDSLDAMLEGKGYFRGGSILVSGTAGTGKSSLAVHLTDASCRRGERTLYFAFEESAGQILRNMRSIGIDMNPWQEQGLLQIHANRPAASGLEAHLMGMLQSVERFAPQVVLIDPLNSFIEGGNILFVKAMLVRFIDHLKKQGVTLLFTDLTPGGHPLEHTDAGISSLMDTWILLRNHEVGHERLRTLTILKSRGMAHSSQVRQFLITSHGVDIGTPFTQGAQP